MVAKNHNILKAKTLSLDVTDISPSTRKVQGYLSVFDVMDSDRDIIRKGAFAESISERGPLSAGNRKVAHLWNHDWMYPVGKFLELFEDDFGLKFVSQIGRSAKGEDVFLNYQDGILREHSIGFYYMEEGFTQINDPKMGGWYSEITKVDLFEGSTVVFGANSLTYVIDVVKSQEEIDSALTKINSQMNSYLDVLANGKGTDERFYEIQMGLKTMQSAYNELIMKKESIKEVAVKSLVEIPKKVSPFKSLISSYLGK